MYFKFPSIFQSGVGQLGVLSAASHVLAGIPDVGDIVEDAERHVSIGACLGKNANLNEGRGLPRISIR